MYLADEQLRTLVLAILTAGDRMEKAVYLAAAGGGPLPREEAIEAEADRIIRQGHGELV